MSAAPDLVADADAVRALAQEILARPEYARAHFEPEVPAWLVRLIEILDSFFGWFEGLYTTSPLLYWLLVAGLVAILFLLIAHMVWSVSRALRDPVGVPLVVEGRDVDFRAAAEALAAEGRYLEATHQLLLACLQRAARAGVIELRPHDTNWVVRTRLEASTLSAQLRAELLSLINATERLWFRERTEDPELYRRWSRAYHDLLQQTA